MNLRVISFLGALLWLAVPQTSFAQEQAAVSSAGIAVPTISTGSISVKPGSSAADGPTSPIGLSARLFLAAEAIDDDAAQSIEEYQQLYELASRDLRARPYGSARQIESIRQAVDAGYRLAWSRFDQGNAAAGNAIVADMSSWLAPYEKPDVPLQLRLPLARVLWVQARQASERQDKVEDDRLRARVLALTSDRKANLVDYGGMSKTRIAALWSIYINKKIATAGIEACQIAAELDEVVPGQMTGRLVQCDNQKARDLIAAKQYSAAKAALDSAEKRVAASASVKLKMERVDTLNIRSSLASAKNDSVAQARSQLAAGRLMTQNLAGVTYSQNTTSQISSLYNAFKDVSFEALPEYNTKEKVAKIKSELFGEFATAIQSSRKAFAKSKYFSAVTANAAANAASGYMTLNEPAKALEFALMAVEAIEDADLPAQLKKYDEDGWAICASYARKVDALILLKQVDNALAAYAPFRAQCDAWLSKYPWDFYSRQTNVTSKLGLLLADVRPADARPLLEYASNWGVKDATTRLADLYRTGAGGPADPERAKHLETLAGYQSMKRFTVPTDFAGVKYPFNVYVMQYGDGVPCPPDRALKPEEANCVGFVGIDDQVQWVKEARGGAVPQDVITSFQKLDKIARENSVSFPDLTVYALGAASEGGSDATAATTKAIFEDMRKTQFVRNPNRQVDPAGVAMHGFDVVSYTQGDKPVAGKANIFALWDGALWLFATADNKAAFVREPERFAPAYGGFASLKMAEGKVSLSSYNLFLRKDNKLYMFDSEGDQKQWAADKGDLALKTNVYWILTEANLEDKQTTLGGMILKLGAVRRPTDFERTRASLPRRSAMVTLAERAGAPASELVSALGNRSWTYILMNRPNDAITDVDRALKLDPNQAWIVGNRADALLMKGQSDDALVLFRSVATLLGPDRKRSMCEFIREDVSLLREHKLAPDAATERILAEIQCVPQAEPAPAPTNPSAKQ